MAREAAENAEHQVGHPFPPDRTGRATRARMNKTILQRLVQEGSPHPRGALWDGKGTNFACSRPMPPRSNSACSTAPARRETGADRAAGIHRPDLPRLYAGGAARPALRLPRARPLRARGRPPLQPQQAAARPLRPRPCRRAEVGPGRVRLHRSEPRRRPDLRRARQRAVHAEMRRRRPEFRLARRARPAADVPWDHTIIYETHVRGFTKLHPEVPENLRGTYAGLATPEVHRLHQVARRHLGRAAADPHLHQRQLSCSKRA